MYFRFGVALVLVVAVSLAGTTLEKRNLELKRAVSRQHYRLEILQEQVASQRVQAAELGAPARLIEQLDPELFSPANPERTSPSTRPTNPPRRKTSPPRTRASP